jgi:hypothetical protein
MPFSFHGGRVLTGITHQKCKELDSLSRDDISIRFQIYSNLSLPKHGVISF